MLGWPLHLLALAGAAGLAYGRTLDVPFYLDDFSSIRENSLVYRWQGWAALREYAPMRVLAYASFAFNYRWGGFDPAGYHVVNLAIHVLAGFASYGLTFGALRTPAMTGRLGPRARALLPPFVAALFVLHPLQTGAVTYIVQRLASLVALFYVAALAAYLQARLARGARRAGWAAACAGCSLLALFTKENAATLPAAFLLLELGLFRAGRRDLPRLAAVAVGGAATVWLLVGLSFGSNPFSLTAMGEVASQSREIGRGAYLATQMPVVWTYVRLFVWPVGLHLDHAVEVLRFSDPRVMAALAGHLVVISAALLLARRRPLIAFGVLFYYLAHVIESGVIPIPELAFEHRSYLPNLGLCLALAAFLAADVRRRVGIRAAVALAVLLPLVLGWTTWRRNELWRDPIAFWQENVRLAPTRARAWGNLGKSLVLAGRSEEGIRALRRSLRLRANASAEDHNWAYDVANLAEAYRRLGRIAEGLAAIDAALDRAGRPELRAALLLGRGNLLLEQERLAEAEAAYRDALRYQEHNLPALSNLAGALALMGRLAAAESLFQQVLRVDPRDSLAREYRLRVRAARLVEEGDAHRSAGRDAQADSAYRAALAALEQAARLNPHHPTAAANRERIRARLAAPPGP